MMKTAADCISVAEYLAQELVRRKRRNDAYSLRAFARDLKLSPSRLSELMSGEHGLSEATAEKIVKALGLKAREKDFFFDLALSTSSRNAKVRELASQRLAERRNVDSLRLIKESQFRTISDWYHSAILELTQVIDFKEDTQWIAQRLGITKSQADDAVERLELLGLLTRDPAGAWQVNPEASATFAETPSTAIRKYHRQILSMAMESLLEDSMEDRELTAMILALPKNRMHEFREEMAKFMTNFWERIENDPKDELYALSIQLCPVRNRRRGAAKS